MSDASAARRRWRLPGCCPGAAIAGAIVGIRNTREAEQLVGAANLELDVEELREIESSDSDSCNRAALKSGGLAA